MKYNKQIDGWRAIAVISVLICHFISFENEYIRRIPFGQGVNLFFVLSGYLITTILLQAKEKYTEEKTSIVQVFKAFYYRRALRIFPIYYLLIFYLVMINFQNAREAFWWLVTYTSNYYYAVPNQPLMGSFNHFWSLAVEEQFYLFWPLVLFVLPKRGIELAIIGMIVLAIGFKFYYFKFYGATGAFNAITISCLDSLGFGALIAYWALYREKFYTRLVRLPFLIFLFSLPFIYLVIYPRPSFDTVLWTNNFLYSLFAFAVVLKASKQNFNYGWKIVLENKWVVYIGKISYGIYVYHLFMPDFYNQMGVYFPSVFFDNAPIRVYFLFFFSIIFSILSWNLIEKPLLQWKNKYTYY